MQLFPEMWETVIQKDSFVSTAQDARHWQGGQCVFGFLETQTCMCVLYTILVFITDLLA